MPTGSKADSGNEEIGPGVIEVRVMCLQETGGCLPPIKRNTYFTVCSSWSLPSTSVGQMLSDFPTVKGIRNLILEYWQLVQLKKVLCRPNITCLCTGFSLGCLPETSCCKECCDMERSVLYFKGYYLGLEVKPDNRVVLDQYIITDQRVFFNF